MTSLFYIKWHNNLYFYKLSVVKFGVQSLISSLDMTSGKQDLSLVPWFILDAHNISLVPWLVVIYHETQSSISSFVIWGL